MSKDKNKERPKTGGKNLPQQDPLPETVSPEAIAPETAPAPEVPSAELEALTAAMADLQERHLRLAAEYENYRKRTQKEKDSIWADCKADTALAFLSVYDNLERALKLETVDSAYAKGVEMTMTGLREVLTHLGITEIPALGEPFDPNLHNAVMHVEDETAQENTIVEVFQTGFQSEDKIIRFSVVKVAN